MSSTRSLLFAVGNFDRSGTTPIPSGIAAWDGSAWRDGADELPFGISSYLALRSVESPEGPLAMVRGDDQQGGYRVAIQEDDGWRVLQGFDDEVLDATVVRRGDANSMYVTGYFSHVGDLPSHGFARYGCAHCPADFDADGDADEADFVAFLDLWTLGDPAADLNRDGYTDTRDVIEFLNLWNDGC